MRCETTQHDTKHKTNQNECREKGIEDKILRTMSLGMLQSVKRQKVFIHEQNPREDHMNKGSQFPNYDHTLSSRKAYNGSRGRPNTGKFNPI